MVKQTSRELEFEMKKLHLPELCAINRPGDIDPIIPGAEIRADGWEASADCPAEIHVVGHPESVNPLALFDGTEVTADLQNSGHFMHAVNQGDPHSGVAAGSTFGDESAIKVIVC